MRWIECRYCSPPRLKRVLIYVVSKYGKGWRTVAEYIPHKSVLAEGYMGDDCDGWEIYDEEKDCYWTPAGFYESEYATDRNYFVSGTVTHWAYLPEPPSVVMSKLQEYELPNLGIPKKA